MSVVYKAMLPPVHRLVALKLLSPHPHLLQLLGKKEIEQRFMAEAMTMVRFRHPHIVDLLDFDIMAGQWLAAPGTPPADIIPMGAADGIINIDDLRQLVSDWLGGI